jgi:alpha-tubulin suppressor-like RCC1 family protein
LQNVSTVKDVAVGTNHACAINGSAVQCWGDTASGKTAVPVIVNTPKQIAAGANHTCAINANGSVSCWGDNSTNQLGDSNIDGIVDGVSSALKIAAGTNHTCAVTGSYSTPSGLRIKCWGDNSAGQTTVPVALTNGVEKPVNISVAGNQTCAIRAGQNVAANAMICWPVSVSP